MNTGFLNRTFHLCRVLGFDVRVHWTMPLYLLIPLHVYRDRGEDGLWLALTGTGLLFGIVLIHELGHALAARRLQVPVEHILLTPIGGLAGLSEGARSPREEFIVTFWGPAVHPVMIAIVGLPYYLVTHHQVDWGLFASSLIIQFFWINVTLLGFNLLPAFPMDGGRLLRAGLASRINAARATIIAAYIGQIAAIIFIAVSIAAASDFRFALAIIGVLILFTCEREKIAARHQDPYGGFAFENEFGMTYYEPSFSEYARPQREKRPGLIARYFQERAERKRELEARHEADVKARVDELLGKVSEVGMDGLTGPERAFLERASGYYKKTP